ncbi:leucine-rich repeat domain-containing protein [Treponema sp.]|uniref:leucine-rich repeat domain-containing protein n=1 Tax=Treponema sp. TaxID=166 RepID=UPI003FA1DA08
MCSNCTDLTDIEFPHGLEEIGKQAFLDCRNLTNIKLPATLRSIGMEGFSNSGLTTVLLPASLKKITVVLVDVRVYRSKYAKQ